MMIGWVWWRVQEERQAFYDGQVTTTTATTAVYSCVFFKFFQNRTGQKIRV